MMEKKYRLTDETIIYCGRELHRIESLCNFNGIEIGQKGGFIENEINLSHNGNCWVFGNSKVYDNAAVSEDAKVCYNAEVWGNVRVFGNALIDGYAKVKGAARVHDYADISGHSIIDGYSHVFDKACITGSAQIRDCARIYGEALVKGGAVIEGWAEVYGNAIVKDMSNIFGKAKIYNHAFVGGNACIYNAIIKDSSDYIVFKNWWSSYRYFTWTRSNNMWLVGCFYGTGEELIAKAYKDSELSGREYERIVRYVESINPPIKKLNRIQKIVCKLFGIK